MEIARTNRSGVFAGESKKKRLAGLEDDAIKSCLRGRIEMNYSM